MKQLFGAKRHRWLAFFMISLLAGCSNAPDETASGKEVLIYCGITMVRPITEIARIIEQEQNVRITISQGGSEDLYQSLKASREGDLYFPGSDSYRLRHQKDGLLTDHIHVGYNQAAFVVHRGNPKGVTADMSNLLRKDLGVVICNPESGSIGKETKRIGDKAGLYQALLDNAVYLTTDSRNLNGALKKGDADLIVNWRATAFFQDNREHMEVIDLDPEQAKPKKLVLNLLAFSSHPDVARRFMAYAASPDGQSIFRKYGFLDSRLNKN